jgi:purine-nucleoside/S-methyl-5'-thioadenosine phosphorylase / adenosine deaminase
VSEFYAVGDHLGIELPGARAVFTTRWGGVSTGPYESLNLGRFTDDDPEAVRLNRDRLETALGVGFAYGRQVHGPRVMTAERPASGEPIEADGQATSMPGVAPMVLTADCLPVGVAGGGAVAMLHAGWRGLAAGVIEEGVSAVRKLGSGGPLAAAIGPAAGVCCYEVGNEVHARFADYGEAVRRDGNIDLKAIAAEQLRRAGVEHVFDAGVCTICSVDFFSHRRDGGVTGRQAGIAWLS